MGANEKVAATGLYTINDVAAGWTVVYRWSGAPVDSEPITATAFLNEDGAPLLTSGLWVRWAEGTIYSPWISGAYTLVSATPPPELPLPTEPGELFWSTAVVGRRLFVRDVNGGFYRVGDRNLEYDSYELSDIAPVEWPADPKAAGQ